jgi:hypothetical protein
MTLSFSLSGTYLDGMYSQFVVNIRMDNAVWLKIRIRKYEIRNKHKIQIFKPLKPPALTGKTRLIYETWRLVLVIMSFGHSNLFRFSYFEFLFSIVPFP